MQPLDRPQAPDPYALLPQVPAFELRSDTFAPGAPVPDETTNTPAGNNISPHLAWSGFPAETKSFAVTCFDPDAPGPSGWWHWTLLDVPTTTTELAFNASGTDQLPAGSVALRGDDGLAAYVGAAPPPDEEHRYFYAVHALDVPTMGMESDAMPGAANMMLVFHTIARAVLVGTYHR
ncbi:MAG: YbhB/YbcL family Raf kinase inhibitor-like protein [Micrococcales bacterium]|nr:YbhB/YbcL family Raf kinase inhibitor-like protein [Micrococcales bacterium]